MALRISAPQLFQANRPARRRSPISLTPLIDVVFILLIFFMLASNVTEWRAISLSTPSGKSTNASMEGSLFVEIRPTELRLSGKAIDLTDLRKTIAMALQKNPEQRVIVQAAPGVIMQRAVDILDILSAAGVQRLSLNRRSKR